MHCPGNEEFVLLCDSLRHKNSLGQSCTAVVERRIGNFHSCELRDVRLKFKDRLQRSLRNLRLIWRVGGVELGPRNQGINNDGNVMMIDSRPDERGSAGRIHGSSSLKVLKKLRLGKPFG